MAACYIYRSPSPGINQPIANTNPHRQRGTGSGILPVILTDTDTTSIIIILCFTLVSICTFSEDDTDDVLQNSDSESDESNEESSNTNESDEEIGEEGDESDENDLPKTGVDEHELQLLGSIRSKGQEEISSRKRKHKKITAQKLADLKQEQV